MDRRTIGRYELVGELGRGAMGVVYRAHDPVMDRTVALKCIVSAALGHETHKSRQRFYREARAAGALAHPGIVPVFDAGEDHGVLFLVMELVQGRTLDDALKQGRRYSLEELCDIGRQIAEALDYAHRHGIVHRDIKPANVLMTAREIYGAERPRITDFGVAKLAEVEMTTTGIMLGTPAYMPPEQFTGAPIDGRTDLFSLGVILYRMATGVPPFAGDTVTVVSYKIVHTDPVPPSQLNPAVNARLEAVLLKCLAKDPEDRFQTGEELAAALAAIVSARSVPVQPGVEAGMAGQASAQPSRDQVPHPPPEPVSPIHQSIPPRVVTPLPEPTGSAARPEAQFSAGGASPSGDATEQAQVANPAQRSGASTSASRSQKTAVNRRPEPRKRGFPIIGWVIIAAVALFGSRYLLQPHVQQALQEAGSSQARSQSPTTPILGASNAPIEFNPRGLDPSRSGQLRLELNGIPPTVPVVLQLDGKPYWTGTSASIGSGLLVIVAPGRHQLRLMASPGTGNVASNALSQEFTPGQRLLLNLEVRPQPSPGASILSRDTRITLSIRRAPAF